MAGGIEARIGAISEVTSSEGEGKPCPFCGIINGKQEHFDIAENKLAKCVMSLEGHPIIFTKKHLTKLDLDKSVGIDDMLAVFELGLQLVPIEGVYNATGFNIVANIGESAGQEIPHIHAHLVPRIEGDSGMRVVITNRPRKRDFPLMADAIKSQHIARTSG